MKFAHTLLAGAALAVSMSTAASAADLLINAPVDPIYDSPLFNFEGLYVGGTAGGALTGGLYGTLGVVVGANFAVTDGIIAGLEFQGDTYWNGGGYAALSALGLGRVGGFINDNTMIYADLGAGFIGGNSVYAFGGGAEMGLSNNLGLRGDVQVLGNWGGAPSATKATVGLMWHLN